MAQIGTIKLQTQNSGVVDVPVFEPGDSASGIYEFVRVETASGPGFIPVTDPVDAAYPYLRVQSQNNGIVAVTDTPGSDIPDSGLSHEHLASSLSAADGDPVSTWDDDEGGDPLINGSAVYRDSAFNGNPTLEFDTDAGGFDGDLTTELQPPFSVWIVVEITSLDGQEYVMPFERADSAGILFRDDDDATRFYGDNALSGISYSWQSSDPLDQYILGYVADGENSIGYLNNSTVSGFTVNNSLDTFSIGSNTEDDRRVKGYISHVLIYDRATTGSFADSIISTLKNIHGVSF